VVGDVRIVIVYVCQWPMPNTRAYILKGAGHQAGIGKTYTIVDGEHSVRNREQLR
jgi:hypothetical protein